MRDSALKPLTDQIEERGGIRVGEELMRDSAMKHRDNHVVTVLLLAGRRRAHARQRFETSSKAASAAATCASEKSSCATAL